MNNTFGFQSIIDYPEAVSVLGLLLVSPSIKTRTLTLEILAAVCCVQNGHRLLLIAMEYLKEKISENFRFQSLIKSITDEVLESKNDSAVFLDYQVAETSVIYLLK